MRQTLNTTGQYIKEFAKTNPITTIAIGGVLFFVIRGQIKKLLKPSPPPPTPIPIPPVPPPTPTPTPKPSPEKGTYSYDSAQYSDWADALQEACSGAGTDMDAILRIYAKQKNRMDILALHDAYGKRKITSPYGWSTDAMSLPATLQYELSDGNFEELNNTIKKTGYQY